MVGSTMTGSIFSPFKSLTAWRRPSAPGELEAEFRFERFAEIVALQFGEKLAKRGPIRKLRDGKAPALGDLWIVGVDFRARLGLDKAGDDEIFERLPGHRRCFQGFQVKTAQGHGTDSGKGEFAAF